MPEQVAASSSPNIEKTGASSSASSSGSLPRDTRSAEYLSEMRAARRAGVRWRRISRWLGLAIFLFGSALLAYVFLQALITLRLFSTPDYLNSQFTRMTNGKTESVIQAGVTVFGSEFLRVLALLLLGFLASAIAARGIQFFAASESVIDEAVVPEE